MVNASTIFENLKTLLNTFYAKVNHQHGQITNDGKLDTANGIVITDNNKNITVSNQIQKSKISDFPTTMTPTAHTHGKITNEGKMDVADGIVTTNSSKEIIVSSKIPTSKIDNFPTIGTGLSTNDFSNTYKNKLNALSTYQIRLSDTRTWNINSSLQNNPSYPNYPHILYVHKQASASDSEPSGAIYCLVTRNRTEAITTGDIIFIVNGVTYVRGIDEDGFAQLTIHLSSGVVYTVIAVYRPDGIWSEAIDIKQMQISGPDS